MTYRIEIRVTGSLTTPIKYWIINFLNLFKKRKEYDFIELRRDLIATLWEIWLHRNEIVFRGDKPNASRVLEIYMENKKRHMEAKRFGRIEL